MPDALSFISLKKERLKQIKGARCHIKQNGTTSSKKNHSDTSCEFCIQVK